MDIVETGLIDEEWRSLREGNTEGKAYFPTVIQDRSWKLFDCITGLFGLLSDLKIIRFVVNVL